MPSCETSSVCRVCKKVFCCAECRERHEKNKHPGRVLNCPLCLSEKLPLRVIEDKEFFCHIVFNHLPLYCSLCGETFTESKDLEKFGTCRWYSDRYHSLVDHNSLLSTPSPASIPPDVKTKEQSVIENICNGNYESLTSPPELHRNTSTPMQVNLICQKTELKFETPSVPIFSFKTPKTNSPSTVSKTKSINLPINESKNNTTSSNYVSFSPCQSSHEITPFRVSSQSRSKDVLLVRTNSERILHVMKEQDEGEIIQYNSPTSEDSDKELTNSESGKLRFKASYDKSEKKSESLKKVRFSDQYITVQESHNSLLLGMTENEEFFEAHDTPFDVRVSPREEKGSFESLFTKINCDHENQKNMEKENSQKIHRQTIGSRILMMVVAENKENITSEITPLIDSGLKQLQHTTKTNSIASSVLKETNHSSPENYSTILRSFNSFMTVSNIESYSTPNSVSSTNYQRTRSSSESNDSTNTGGIFSAVANAVKSALSSISGMNVPKSISYENISQGKLTRQTTLEQSPPITSLASSLLHRPGKRPRETIENIYSKEYTKDANVSRIEDNSPLAKRQRGWYKIKAREPIPRMRNNHITSPRGISSETQVFSQGSLSVGDTVLPIPARAHQSTQTDL